MGRERQLLMRALAPASLVLALISLAFGTAGCSLEPVSLEQRPCRSYVDCLASHGYYCQAVDSGVPDGGFVGMCVPIDGSVLTMDAGRDAGADGGGVDADLDARESDAGESDAGESDAGELDAGELDAGESDAGEDAASAADAGELDAGAADAAADDADVDANVDDANVDTGT